MDANDEDEYCTSCDGSGNETMHNNHYQHLTDECKSEFLTLTNKFFELHDAIDNHIVESQLN